MKRSADQLTAALGGLCALGLVVSSLQIARNHAAFEITRATHTQDAGPGWREASGEPAGFTPVKLPYFLEDGYFRVEFASDATQLDLDLYVQDCAMKVFIDGVQVFKRADECESCLMSYATSDRRCDLLRISTTLEPAQTHVLALLTQNAERKTSLTRRDGKQLWVQHDANAFWARLVALLCGSILAALAWSRFRHGTASHVVSAAGRFVVQRRAFLVVATVAVVARLIVAPSALTTDVSQSAMLYAEDLVQRDDARFTKLDPQYRAAKYDGESHMHKPPGTYYQYAIPRLIFGYSDIYYRYLTRLPAIVGDLLIAWVLLIVIGKRRDEDMGVACAAFFLFSAGVFATDGFLARPDSLAIAFLLLAMLEPRSWRFSALLGIAVAWKHLALLVTPWFAFQRESLRRLVIAGAVTLLLCSPFLLDDPVFFLQRLTLPQLEKGYSGLAWIANLEQLGWSADAVAAIGRVFTVGFMLALVALPFVTRPDPFGTVAITFALFVVCAKNVHEHYILWSFPALLITYVSTRRLSILIAILIASLSMAFHHEGQMEIGGEAAVTWSGLLAVSYAVAAAQMIWDARIPRTESK